ncbi:flagellar biosynthesis regulator FlhF [Sporolactobacillus shoreae]|nr:flagellar biosynthesis regulator FlhF [Sporolactobacillus shoreae]
MKKIIAPTMAQAIEKVKQELGGDAVIFHTKKVTKGRFFNLFKRESVEVLAANDTDTDFSLKDLPKNAEKKHSGFSETAADRVGLPFRKVTSKVDRIFSGPEYLDSLRVRLLNQGLDEGHVDSLIKTMVKKWYQSDESMDDLELERSLKALLVQRLNPVRFQNQSSNERFTMFIGPTGVGKTTTIAKIAGREILEGGKRIAFITTDTFRIAAINQLKMYADILNVPIEVAYSQKDLHDLVLKYAEYDHVFIDTAGRNFQDERYVQDIGELIRDDPQIDLRLVLAATAKYADLNSLVHSFQRLSANQLIITKLDETTTYGAVVSTLLHFPEKRVLYITDGQEVPDDLRIPNVNELINLMLGDKNDE